MNEGVDPQIRRQWLGAELRRLREGAGLSGRDLAERIGISQSKVSRIESGTGMPSSDEVMRWAAAVKASDDTRQTLVDLVQAALTEVQTWRTVLAHRHIQGDIQKLEHSAQRILTFQCSLVPGLLQTAEYAKRVLSLFHPAYAEGRISTVLAARLDRQLVLYDEAKRFEFLITEAALRWRPGPPRVLLAQLDRIASLSTLENVSIGLIPLGVEAKVSTAHPFVMLGADPREVEEDHNTVVTVETVHANLVVQGAENVSLYRIRWSLLREMAIFDDEARAFLSRVADQVRAERQA